MKQKDIMKTRITRDGTESTERVTVQALWGTSCEKATHLKMQALGIQTAQIKINSRNFTISKITKEPDNANTPPECFSVNIVTNVICVEKMRTIPNLCDRKFTDNRNFCKTEIGEAGKNIMLSQIYNM